MTQNIQVSCMINRYWDVSMKGWDGEAVKGTLIDISTQTAEDNSGKIIPVGIVLLDDDSLDNSEIKNTFQCIPMEFIIKI